MPLESDFDNVDDLNSDWPLGTDPKSEGANNLRGIKRALQGNVGGDGLSTRLQGGGDADAFTVGELFAVLLGLTLEVDARGNAGEDLRFRIFGDDGGAQLRIDATTGRLNIEQLDGLGSVTGLLMQLLQGTAIIDSGQAVLAQLLAQIGGANEGAIRWNSQGVLEITRAGDAASVLRADNTSTVFDRTVEVREAGSGDARLRTRNSGVGIDVRATSDGRRFLEALNAAGALLGQCAELYGGPRLNAWLGTFDSGGTVRSVGFNEMDFNSSEDLVRGLSDADAGERVNVGPGTTGPATVNITTTTSVDAVITLSSESAFPVTINPAGGATLRWFQGVDTVAGPRTLQKGAVVTLHKVTANDWHVWGAGIS